jgi:NAD(P)-dependent dehydrogenase (short-subunit alcohol dehydrogenase family)
MGMLDGKAAVVTGAGRGIGRGIAIALAREGAKVVVNDLGVDLTGEGKDAAPASKVVAEIAQTGGVAEANFGSVVDFNAAEAMVAQAVKSFGRIDILVNVAGNLRDRMIFNMSEEDWDAVINVHLKGTFNTMRAASLRMREQKSGRIISMSSVSALGAPGQPNYAAAKAGIIGLTWSSANALGKYNVTVNAVMPSGATRMIDSTPRARETFEATGKWPSEIAVGTDRDPDNVAPLVVYLASDAAKHVNGQVFHARGYRYTILYQPTAQAAIQADRRWDPEELVDIFPRTLGTDLSAPPSIAFGTALDDSPKDQWTDLGGNRRVWKNPDRG